VHIDFEHPSFNWGNGLYAIISEEGDILNMCRINNHGQPEKSIDGELSITCTGKGNKGITVTNLFLKV
jgi:hypothetical protein